MIRFNNVQPCKDCLYKLIIMFFSLALHSDKNLVATGQIGKEPFICVWDSTTIETVSILQGGHERGIAAVAFSKKGNVSHGEQFNGV